MPTLSAAVAYSIGAVHGSARGRVPTLGVQTPDADWMRRNDLLTRPVDVGTVATNEFLPGEGLGDVAGEPKAP